MAFLKDSKGVDWELKLTLSAIRSVCKKLKISMAQLTMLDLDLGEVLDSIHFLCSKQLRAEKVSVEEFYDRIDEVPPSELFEVLQDTLYDAFPKMKQKAEDDAPFDHGE